MTKTHTSDIQPHNDLLKAATNYISKIKYYHSQTSNYTIKCWNDSINCVNKMSGQNNMKTSKHHSQTKESEKDKQIILFMFIRH